MAADGNAGDGLAGGDALGLLAEAGRGGAATEEASMEAEDMVCCDAGGAIGSALGGV